MTDEIDAAGALITATATAGLIDRPSPTTPAQDHDVCANCRSPVSGRFCGNCGQPAHVHRSLLHIVEEILHGILHLDGRIWRTLPMLIARPGQMSRQYIEGRRTRYVSPIALYLFSVFLMFFVFSLTDGPGIATDVKADQTDAAGAAPAQRTVDDPASEAGQEAPAGTTEASVMKEIQEAAENGDITVETGIPGLDEKI